METINKAIIAKFSELVYSMMTNNEPYDMAVVEVLTEDFMSSNGLEFKDYTDLLIELDGDESARGFLGYETTSEYFYDTINSMAITKNRIKTIIEMTVKF